MKAFLDGKFSYKDTDLVMIATPISYSSVKFSFGMKHIEDVVNLAWKVKQNVAMVIKSIIPIDYNRKFCLLYAERN